MKEHEVEGYVSRQFGPTPAQWEDIARSLAYGAKSAKLYFDALVAQGFTRDSALKIICAHGCSPKWPWDGTTTNSEE